MHTVKCGFALSRPSVKPSSTIPSPRLASVALPVLVAKMEMPKLRVPINDKLIQKVNTTAERIWPGQGRRAVSRLTRDAIRRYGRYVDGTARGRSKR